MDTISKEKRSAVMSRVKGKNTGPELLVRKQLHRLGFRFRLHRSDLPGRPDIVLPKHQLCIFINGCFWHQHTGCARATMPSSRVLFWRNKLRRNVARDRENIGALVELGWHTLVIWECEARNLVMLLGEKKIGGIRSNSSDF